MPRFFLKPLWARDKRPFDSKSQESRVFTILSIILQRVEVKAIGRWDDAAAGSFIGLGTGTINDFFQLDGKVPWSQDVLMSVRITSRHEIGKLRSMETVIWSSPVAVSLAAARAECNSFMEKGSLGRRIRSQTAPHRVLIAPPPILSVFQISCSGWIDAVDQQSQHFFNLFELFFYSSVVDFFCLDSCC